MPSSSRTDLVLNMLREVGPATVAQLSQQLDGFIPPEVARRIFHRPSQKSRRPTVSIEKQIEIGRKDAVGDVLRRLRYTSRVKIVGQVEVGRHLVKLWAIDQG